jgi:hypothetical protein
MKLDPRESGLVGKWIMENGRTRADLICERISWLTSYHLEKITVIIVRKLARGKRSFETLTTAAFGNKRIHLAKFMAADHQR